MTVKLSNLLIVITGAIGIALLGREWQVSPVITTVAAIVWGFACARIDS